MSPELWTTLALRSVVARVPIGGDIAESPRMQRLLDGLEYFLPSVLAELYPYWKGEGLDGFYLAEAKKTGPDAAELRGVCILITDQTITPFHLRLRASSTNNTIDWMECRLGKRGNGNGGMERIRWAVWQNASYKLLRDSVQPMEWAYSVSFGQ